jgi:hypothetical protein
LHPAAGLGLHHRQPITGPVEIGEPEPFESLSPLAGGPFPG